MEDIANVNVSEIDITPKMIEAGALALARFETYFSTLEEEAERVFRAIIEAAPRTAAHVATPQKTYLPHE